MASLPFSKSKHYLTGIDWILHGFDCMNKKATGAGNAFQVVMELEGAPPEDEARDSLECFVRKFPLLGGRTRRDCNLAPYWEMPSNGPEAALRVHHPREGEDVFQVLEEGVNAPFESDREHLAFYLVPAGERTHAAVKFDHRVFDAHGAEAFLSMFEEDWEAAGARSWESPPPEPAHLNRWREKFESGRQLNRALLRLVEDGPPRALPLDPIPKGRGFRFEVVPFTEPETREIIERAESEAGYLMAMPYALALSVQALDAVFSDRGVGGGDYVIPVTMDTRPSGGVLRDVFFNHVSLLLFRIRAGEAEDLPLLLQSIKGQLYEQVKTGLTRHLLDASLLMRIVPVSTLSRLLKLYLKDEIASFCFSFLGDTGQMPTRFMGKRVRHSYHMTRVPVPPGLGLFFHQSQGRLKACLSYTEGLLSHSEVRVVVDGLKSRLKG